MAVVPLGVGRRPYIVMAHVVMALYSYGCRASRRWPSALYSYGLYSYGVGRRHAPEVFGKPEWVRAQDTAVPCTVGRCCWTTVPRAGRTWRRSLTSTGAPPYIVMAYIVVACMFMAYIVMALSFFDIHGSAAEPGLSDTFMIFVVIGHIVMACFI